MNARRTALRLLTVACATALSGTSLTGAQAAPIGPGPLVASGGALAAAGTPAQASDTSPDGVAAKSPDFAGYEIINPPKSKQWTGRWTWWNPQYCSPDGPMSTLGPYVVGPHLLLRITRTCVNGIIWSTYVYSPYDFLPPPANRFAHGDVEQTVTVSKKKTTLELENLDTGKKWKQKFRAKSDVLEAHIGITDVDPDGQAIDLSEYASSTLHRVEVNGVPLEELAAERIDMVDDDGAPVAMTSEVTSPGTFTIELVDDAAPGACDLGTVDGDTAAAITSQNFEAEFDATDSQGAEDLTPAKTCVVSNVHVPGQYYNGSGPAVSENVMFYADNGGTPGAVVSSQTVAGTDSAGTFDLVIDPVTLTGGQTYWLSVQANLDFATGGQWGWENTSTVNGSPALWQNPGDGFGTGCTSWSNMQTCVQGAAPGPDFMFTLS